MSVKQRKNAKHAEVLSGATFKRAANEAAARKSARMHVINGHRVKVERKGGKWGCWVWPKRAHNKYPTVKNKAEALAKRSKKRNPEAGAVAMREAFTGLPTKKTVVVARDEHVHGHLAEIGPLIELRGKTINRDPFLIEFARSTNPRRKSKDIVSKVGSKTSGWLGRRAKSVSKLVKGFSSAWINGRKRNPGGPVLLCCNEDGSHLFIEGGDQSINLDSVGLGELSKKEVATIGDVWYIVYHCRKKFAGEKEEEHDYEHKFSEDSDGPRPTLRYDVKNKHLFVDGGVYSIPRALIGASQGLTD